MEVSVKKKQADLLKRAIWNLGNVCLNDLENGTLVKLCDGLVFMPKNSKLPSYSLANLNVDSATGELYLADGGLLNIKNFTDIQIEKNYDKNF